MAASRRSLWVLMAVVCAGACGPKGIAALDEGESESESESGDAGHDPPSDSAGGSLCDPVTQDCGGGQGCYVSELDNPFECLPLGCGGGECPSEGEPCLHPNDCLPGLVCVPGSVVPDCINEYLCCTRYCDLRAPVCSAGTMCMPYFDDPAPGLDYVGVCVVP